MSLETDALIQFDKAHVWHPFTQMAEWIEPEHEPVVLTSGRGAWLEDSRGRRYLDGNASIWTNVHGHRHPALDAAITAQLGKVARSFGTSFSSSDFVATAKRDLTHAHRRSAMHLT